MQNYMKTIVSAVQAWADGKIADVKSWSSKEIDDVAKLKANSVHNHDSDYDAKGSAEAALSDAKGYTDAHNVDDSAHSDIREMMSFLADIIEPMLPKDTLNNTSWDNISKIASLGLAANCWSVGDTKMITLNGTVGTLVLENYETWVYILGFDHNGAKNTIDFGTFKTAATSGTDVCLIDGSYNSPPTTSGAFTMNTSDTNSGGWAGSHMRKTVLGSDSTPTSPTANTLLAAFPSDLRQYMKAMTIYTDNTGGGSNTASYVTTSVDYLPLLAEYEIFGRKSYANSAEQNYQA